MVGLVRRHGVAGLTVRGWRVVLEQVWDEGWWPAESGAVSGAGQVFGGGDLQID